MLWKILGSISIFLNLFVTGELAKGTPFYVDPNGSNTYNGLAQQWDGNNGPWKTIQYAVSNVPEGSTIRVANGTYSGALRINTSNISLYGESKDNTIIQPGLCQGDPCEFEHWTKEGDVYCRDCNTFDPEPYNVHLIRMDGYGITELKSKSDFDNPSGIGINPYNNIDDINDFDFSFCEGRGGKLWVKLAHSGSIDSLFALPMAGNYSGGVYITATNVRLEGFKIQYLIGVFVDADDANIVNNNIQRVVTGVYGAGGIVVGGTDFANHILLDGNIIKYIGTPLMYDDMGRMTANNKDHCIYLSKATVVNVCNNNLSQCIGGASMHPYCESDASYPKDCNIHENTIGGNYGGFIGRGTNINVYNNTISYPSDERHIWRSSRGFHFLYPMPGSKVYNNIVLPGYVYGIGLENVSIGAIIKNNIILADPDKYCVYIIEDTSYLSSIEIDYNAYYNGPSTPDGLFKIGGSVKTWAQYQSSTYPKEANSLFGDPKLVDNRPGEDSPCIDAGDKIAGLSYNGLAPDIGANESDYARYKTGLFFVKNSSDKIMAMVTGEGDLLLDGSLTQSTTPSASGNEEFRVQGSGGNDVAIVDIANGNTRIAGVLHQGCENLVPSGGSNFVVKDTDEDVVSYIDAVGDVYLKGKLCTNVEILPPLDPPSAPPITIPDSVDNNTLNFTIGSDGEWFGQNTIYYYDNDAAQSPDINDSQESGIHTTVDGTGTVRFYWRVSSEQGFDYLEFYIDSVLKSRISGEADWQQESFSIDTAGSHTLDWQYSKDGSVSSGSDTSWLDKVEWEPGTPPPPPPPPVTLAEALDSTSSFTTGGNADWFGQSAIYYYGNDAAQSGDINDTNESWLRTTVNGTGTIRFYWKVSSESELDFLNFYVDSVRKHRISGEVDWAQKSYVIDSSGSHTLEWRYSKDGSMDSGSDCGWVDKMEWTPAPQDPLSQALDSTLTFTSGGDADWFSQIIIWYYDGDAAQSGDISDNQESWLQTTIEGSGTVEFYWKVSSEWCDYLAFYIDDVYKSDMSGFVDWQYRSYQITGSGTHTLQWKYMKDGTITNGYDCGWVDYLRFSQ